MNSDEKRKEMEQLLSSYFDELVMELNLRLLTETDAKTCLSEPLLWVDKITVTSVTYPEIPIKENFLRKMVRKLKHFWKKLKPW